MNKQTKKNFLLTTFLTIFTITASPLNTNLVLNFNINIDNYFKKNKANTFLKKKHEKNI